MSFALFDTMKAAQDITQFIQTTFQKQKITKAVIAVSGGLDSAVSLTFLTRALGPENVYPVLLPYGDQPVHESQAVCKWNSIPDHNVYEIEITQSVDCFFEELLISEDDLTRRGNVMARTRMIIVYDKAKELEALVGGTENKSEKHLGYFTRFGDGASDIEPIQHLYKTQVRMLAEHVGLPSDIINKEPSAGLWPGQTDRSELGFTYEEADLVLKKIVDEQPELFQQVVGTGPLPGIVVDQVDQTVVNNVLNKVRSQHFKQVAPYTI